MDQKQTVLNFIKKQKLAVLSTVSKDNKPEAAVIEFGETADLEIVFDCLRTSRKYLNLKNNNKVAIVTGWDENITVQYEGEAREIDPVDLEKYTRVFFEKSPEARKWENVKGIRFFKVTPKWIRYSDLNQNPWYVFEINC